MIWSILDETSFSSGGANKQGMAPSSRARHTPHLHITHYTLHTKLAHCNPYKMLNCLAFLTEMDFHGPCSDDPTAHYREAANCFGNQTSRIFPEEFLNLYIELKLSSICEDLKHWVETDDPTMKLIWQSGFPDLLFLKGNIPYASFAITMYKHHYHVKPATKNKANVWEHIVKSFCGALCQRLWKKSMEEMDWLGLQLGFKDNCSWRCHDLTNLRDFNAVWWRWL